jgi:hypothetical protein
MQMIRNGHKNMAEIAVVSHVHDVQITRESPNYRIG